MTTPAAPDPNAASGEAEELSFEDALEQVEVLIEQIETGEIGLEESLKAYERGTSLLARCRSVLERAEQKVRDLEGGKPGGLMGGGEMPSGGPDADDDG